MNIEHLIGQPYSVWKREAEQWLRNPPPAAFEQAAVRYSHPAPEARYFALVALGGLAVYEPQSLRFLEERTGSETAWQVNEGLAVAFDFYCAGVGYEEAIPDIRRWMCLPAANQRRAVSEGLRPWTARKRAVFARHPELAIELLGTLKDDDSRSVQESVGNALRDISRSSFDLVLAALRAWIEERPHSKARRTIAKFALERAVKEDPSLKGLYGAK